MSAFSKVTVLSACLALSPTSYAELYVLGDITPAAYLTDAHPEAPATGNVQLFMHVAEDALSLGRVYILGSDPYGIQKGINQFFVSLQVSVQPIHWCESLNLSPSDLLIVLNPDPSCREAVSNSVHSHLKKGGKVLFMFEWQPIPEIENTWLQASNWILERIGSAIRIDADRVSVGDHIAHPTKNFPSGIGAVHFGAAHPVVGGETWLENQSGVGFLAYDAGPFE